MTTTYPTSVHTEILPNLFMGGTDDDDTIGRAGSADLGFDVVVTAYAWARPASDGVELRCLFPDTHIANIDLAAVRAAADLAFAAWTSGRKVLIRCQAGLNRSGLITVLTLRKAGYASVDAIELLRRRRASQVLCNPTFEAWLLSLDGQASSRS